MKRTLPFVIVAVLACTRSDPPATAPVATASASPTDASAPPSVASSVASPAPVDGGAALERRHACSRDVDCTLSCGHGAVNRAWYQEKHPGGEACEDGCAAKGLSTKCSAGACVALRGGALEPRCTGLVNPVAAIGPFHRCAKAADCELTCKYGAVNAALAKSLVDDCDDGCAVHSVDCRAGTCVALNAGAVVAGCTRVSIWK